MEEKEEYTVLENFSHFGLCVFLIFITLAWISLLLYIIKHIWPFLVVMGFVALGIEMAKIKKGM